MRFCLFKSIQQFASARGVRFALLVGFLLAAAAHARADSIELSSIITERGKTVQMPIQLSASTDIAAANLRLLYDAAVIESIAVLRGPLTPLSFLVENHQPLPGQLNLLVASESGADVMKPRAGVLAYLQIKIRSDAPWEKWSYIRFSPQGSDPFTFPGSSISTLSGQQIGHTQKAGAIFVARITQSRVAWPLYE